MINGFQLRRLSVTGKSKEPAEVVFGPGLNVISGASNTGKSYILQCIDFMFGATKRPKNITESLGYETVFLEIEDHAGKIHQLERSLSGRSFLHREIADGHQILQETLAEKHDPSNTKTVSGLLLGLSDAWGLKIRTNEAGNTRGVGFRDLSWIAIMDEVRIIGEGSPVLTGQYTTKTEELSFFKLLLSGVDDASVIAHESRQDSLAKKKAQLELLDRMIPNLEAEIAELDKEPESIEERRHKLDDAVAVRTQALTANQLEITGLETERQEAWKSAKQLESQEANAAELKRRFSMLRDHYNNDLARLQAIVEAEGFFSQLNQVRCPLCGTLLDHHDPDTHGNQIGPDQLDDIRRAARAEAAKIRGLLQDLVGTTEQLDTDLSGIRELREKETRRFKAASQEIATRLEPAANQYKLELKEALGIRDRLAQAETLKGSLKNLKSERERVAAIVWKKRPKEANPADIYSSVVESFVLNIQTTLEAWRYPGLTRVTFSPEHTDLIISGKDRASEGKGFRAIANAAFMIGLLDHCSKSTPRLPHPGLVVLDSPLVTYKRRDTAPGEAIPEDITAAFYENLATTPPSLQIIVLENNDPSPEVQSRIRYTHFSRSPVGRFGFFPPEQGKS